MQTQKTQGRKGLILYNTTNGIIALKKYVYVDQYVIANKFEEEIGSPLRGKKEKQLALKIPNISISFIFIIFLLLMNLSKNIICSRNKIWKIWGF